jgi:mycothiol synthase
MEVTTTQRLNEKDRAEIEDMFARCRVADGHHPLSDHAWLDLVDGGRPGFAALLAHEPGHVHPVGYGQVSGTPAPITTQADRHTSWQIDIVVDPHHRFDWREIADALMVESIVTVDNAGGGRIHHWVSHPTASHDAFAADHGFTRGRDLWQMRIPLPLSAEVVRTPLTTQPFRVGVDEHAWVDLNNRAFAWHPEQGNWSIGTLSRREQEPWFDPQGFLLHHRDDKLAGFCWTKIHHDHDPVLGEIYVIAVDPAFHGHGLGRALTVAGLCSLADRGVRHGMLYVDAANTAAVAMYQKLGFVLDHVNRAYIADR